MENFKLEYHLLIERIKASIYTLVQSNAGEYLMPSNNIGTSIEGIVAGKLIKITSEPRMLFHFEFGSIDLDLVPDRLLVLASYEIYCNNLSEKKKSNVASSRH